MKLAIGSDKSGFNLKESIKAYLTEQGIAFDDLGTADLDHVKPYYVVASEIAPLVQNGTYDRAILICGTGAGVSVVAAGSSRPKWASRGLKPSSAPTFCRTWRNGVRRS